MTKITTFILEIFFCQIWQGSLSRFNFAFAQIWCTGFTWAPKTVTYLTVPFDHLHYTFVLRNIMEYISSGIHEAIAWNVFIKICFWLCASHPEYMAYKFDQWWRYHICCMYCLYTGIACFSLSCKVLWVSESALWIPCQYCTVTARCFRAPCWCMARPHTSRLRRTDAPLPWGPLTGGSCCWAWCWTSATRTSSWSNTSLPATLPHPPPSMEMAPSPKWGVSSWTKMRRSFVEQLQSCRGCPPKFAPMFRWLAGGSRAFAASQTLWWWRRSSSKRDLKPAAFSDWNVQSHFIILVIAEEPRTLPHCGNLCESCSHLNLLTMWCMAYWQEDTWSSW